MFFDIGPLELVVLMVLAMIIFGPEKLPKLIQDVAAFIRKVRQFSDSAKEDIRSELGPEFKDFEFEDLNPKNFARKHLLNKGDLDLDELRNSLDFRSEIEEVKEAVNEIAGETTSSRRSIEGPRDSDRLSKRDTPSDPLAKSAPRSTSDPLAKQDPLAKGDPLAKEGAAADGAPGGSDPLPAFDPDAT